MLSRIAAIRASNSWRAVETLRRLKRRWAGRAGAMAPSDRTPRARTRAVPEFVRTATLGVNVSGYLNTESGMGEAARASIRSLEAVGMPVALNNVPSQLRKRDTSYAGRFGETNPHPFNLVHLNADNMGWFAEGRGRAYFRNRYTIGYWFWELAAFREEWVPFFEYVDEVWAASDFVRESFAAWSPVPVVRMPLPVVLPAVPDGRTRAFRSAASGTVFLYMFDVSSQTERKNPRGAIDAFRRARFEHDEAVLVLKFTNAGVRSRSSARPPRAGRRAARAIPRRLHESGGDLRGLLATADCYFLATPIRRVRPDHARVDEPREARDRDGVFWQHGLHDRREQLPAAVLAC